MGKKERNIITDKLVEEKTGKVMEEWFLLLDKRGAQKLNSTQIYELVNSLPGMAPLGEWNRGLLSTSYQWSRGLRQRGEKAGGFEIGVSKTVAVPIAVLFDSWINSKTRDKWLGKAKIIIRRSTKNKSARITWSDGVTSLSVDFYEKGKDKAQVVVQHLKIANSVQAEEMKVFWNEKLNKLKLLLEK